MSFLPLSGGVFMGWALGANDSANVFGTAVASRVISFRKAALLCSAMVILGALLQGEAGMHTYRDLAAQNLRTVMVATIAAALAVTFMTFKALPVSASQSMVGAITGIGLASDTVNWSGLIKILICWVATPIGSLLIGMVVYKLLSHFFTRVPMGILTRDQLIWGGLVVVGCYGAYALGANNVANVTGIYSGQFTELGLTDLHLALLGGLSISFGTLTYSKKVMLAVGAGIMRLDALMSLVAVTSMAITVHIFAILGVPVSTSHAVVGAICGIGFLTGGGGLKIERLRTISLAWLFTPLLSLILSSAGFAIFC